MGDMMSRVAERISLVRAGKIIYEDIYKYPYQGAGSYNGFSFNNLKYGIKSLFGAARSYASGSHVYEKGMPNSSPDRYGSAFRKAYMN